MRLDSAGEAHALDLINKDKLPVLDDRVPDRRQIWRSRRPLIARRGIFEGPIGPAGFLTMDIERRPDQGDARENDMPAQERW